KKRDREIDPVALAARLLRPAAPAAFLPPPAPSLRRRRWCSVAGRHHHRRRCAAAPFSAAVRWIDLQSSSSQQLGGRAGRAEKSRNWEEERQVLLFCSCSSGF
ncbi:Os11g0611600, partial [Oryza sativa Japonica Group]